MKTKNYLLAFIIFFGLFSTVSSYAQDYNVVSASYLGGDSDEEWIKGTGIQTDGTIVLYGSIDLSSIGGVPATLLNGAHDTTLTTIVRISYDGQTVFSVTKVAGTTNGSNGGYDFALDGNDNIYITMDGAAMKLNKEADTILWSNDDYEWERIDAGPSGFFALYGEPGIDYSMLHLMHVYDPEHNLVMARYEELGGKDITIDEKNRQVIYGGFSIKWHAICEYHLPWYRAINFNGAIKYTGYNWSVNDFIGINNYNMARPCQITMGQDNKLYLGVTWTGQSDNPTSYDPFDRVTRVHPVGGDKYHENLDWGEEGDTKAKYSWLGYDPVTGDVEKRQLFANITNEGCGPVFVREPEGLKVDVNGKIYVAGNSATGFPVPPRCDCNGENEECFNPTNAEYNGGFNLLVMNNTYTTRLFAAMVCDGAAKSCGVRTLNGQEVIIVGGSAGVEDEDSKYHINAVQSTPGTGKDDAYFCIINSPPATTAPSAPDDLQIDFSSPTYITISWNDNSNNEDGFVIERSTDGGSFEQIATVYPEETEFNDMTVDGSTDYNYRVCAFNLEGKSSYTGEQSTNTGVPDPPASPTGLNGEPLSEFENFLEWDDVDNEEGYVLERMDVDVGEYSVAGDIPANTTTYNDATIDAGVKYAYRIKAYNADGFSGYSDTIHLKSMDLPLHDTVTSSNPTNGICYGLYEHVSDFTSYPDFSNTSIISWVRDGSGSNMDPKTQCEPEFESNEGNYAFKYYGYLDVPVDGTYYFRYLAHKRGMLFIDEETVIDNSTWKWGAWEEKGAIGLKAGKHKFVCELVHSYTKDKEVVHEVYIKGPGIPDQLIPDNMLYRDQTCMDLGSPPAAPTNLVAEEISPNLVKISWDDNADNESQYGIEATPHGFDSYDRFKELKRVSKDDTSYIFVNIPCGQLSEFRVRALNAHGYSDFSNIDSMITSCGDTSYIPAPPTNLRVNLTTATQINISWDDNSSREDHFVIEYKLAEDGSFNMTDTVGRDVSSATIGGLTELTAYTFRVKAINLNGSSDYTNEVTDTTDQAVSVVSVNPESTEMVIYPNPVKDQLQVIVPGYLSNDGVYNLEVYAINGMKILEIGNLSSQLVSINTDRLDAGVYILKITNGTETVTSRFIKQ